MHVVLLWLYIASIEVHTHSLEITVCMLSSIDIDTFHRMTIQKVSQ